LKTLEDGERAAVTCSPHHLRTTWIPGAAVGDQERFLYPSSRFVSDEKAADWRWCGDSKD
jgi:hypothetical protein